MRRIIQWYDKFFIDVFEVCSDNELSKDWTFHIDGSLKTSPVGAKEEDAISSKNPQKILHDIKSLKKADGVIKSEYDCGEFDLDIVEYQMYIINQSLAKIIKLQNKIEKRHLHITKNKSLLSSLSKTTFERAEEKEDPSKEESDLENE